MYNTQTHTHILNNLLSIIIMLNGNKREEYIYQMFKADRTEYLLYYLDHLFYHLFYVSRSL